ncbi:hypothetical protein PAV_109p00340 (plasmid) [Paenibacillus alvei DSM 29]|nr:hypothetical protein PAV_109p00340 [Paenibacillus alvei DSM 29]
MSLRMDENRTIDRPLILEVKEYPNGRRKDVIRGAETLDG